MDTKQCTKCKLEYPLEHFSKKGSGRNTRCAKCVAEYYRAYYHDNKERRDSHKARVKANKEKNRSRDLAKKYGTTEEKIDEIFSLNNGMCAICKIKKATAVDHCHASGVVRGALCHGCNTGLGLFGDNIDALASAIEYLRAVSPLPDKE